MWWGWEKKNRKKKGNERKYPRLVALPSSLLRYLILNSQRELQSKVYWKSPLYIENRDDPTTHSNTNSQTILLNEDRIQIRIWVDLGVMATKKWLCALQTLTIRYNLVSYKKRLFLVRVGSYRSVEDAISTIEHTHTHTHTHICVCVCVCVFACIYIYICMQHVLDKIGQALRVCLFYLSRVEGNFVCVSSFFHIPLPIRSSGCHSK